MAVVSMRKSILWSFFALSVAVMLALVVASALLMQQTIIRSATVDLMQECQTVAAAFERVDDPDALAGDMGRSGQRLTLIDPDGTVVYDNMEDPAQLGSHADRPEVRDALASGSGSAVRGSATLSEVRIYGAVRIDTGQVLRLSVSRAGVLDTLTELLPVACAALVVILLACWALSRWVARRLVAPLNTLDLAHPLEGGATAYQEIMPLLARMDEQNRQINSQVRHLSDNDRMRVEFTANVTHELKTPLTSISGYAELIETGLAAPADVPEFARRIHEESMHLTSLVNDILTLSKMDEAERVDAAMGVFEPVELTQVAVSVADRLDARARDAQVSIAVDGSPEPCVIKGIPKLVDQIVFNLCDNAIRYNRKGGTVTIKTGHAQGRPFVSVADTGIGIAPENLQNVFARFYRVDPSRSRETGGTGLGLAIVKHAARCHDARLEITSELGAGTTITVTFHAAEDPAPAAATAR